MNAESSAEIIYTRGASEAINLVAASWGGANIGPGDEIVISEAEHHSNIVPWQILRDQKGAVLKVLPVDDEGAVHLDQFRELLSERTKIVAVTHVSNVLGTVYPIKEMARLAHQVGAVILIDGCQGITHMPVDVRDLDCDFYAFSGHKLYGPSGIGVLYGKAALLEAMPPYQSGGDMIERVTFEKSTWAELPHKFEAGTPAIAQAIGLGAAVDYVSQVGMAAIAAHEQELLTYTTQRLASVPGLRLIGTAPGKVSVVSFVMDCAHPHDISTIIDQTGVAIRAGHHCAQPLIDRFDIPSAARASFGMYNTVEEADRLVAGLEKVKEIFAR